MASACGANLWSTRTEYRAEANKGGKSIPQGGSRAVVLCKFYQSMDTWAEFSRELVKRFKPTGFTYACDFNLKSSNIKRAKE